MRLLVAVLFLSVSLAAGAQQDSEKTAKDIATLAEASMATDYMANAQPANYSTGAETEVTCTYEGKSYKKGARVCRQDGFWHECGNDGWINLKQKCK